MEQTERTAETPSARETKSANVTRMLRRTKGATIADIMATTGWKPHSARAFLSGLRKKGRKIVREERKSGDLAYRIIKSSSSK